MKNEIRHYLHLYKIIFIQDLKCKMSYPIDFIISCIGLIITNISAFIVFKILFNNFNDIAGWGYYEIMFLYSFSLLSITPAQCFLDNNWNLGDNVLTGDFIKYCVKPINIYFYYNSEVFDVKGIGQFMIGAGALAYAWQHLHIPFTVVSFVLLILNLLTASLFMMGLINLAAAVNFKSVQGAEYIMSLIFKLGDYARYPISIFNGILKWFFTLIIPIGFIAYYPSLIFLTPENIPILSYCTAIIGIIFFYISYKIWMKGAVAYDGTGS